MSEGGSSLNRRTAFFIYTTLIILAVVGFGSILIRNPMKLLQSIVVFGVALLIIWFIFKKVMQNRQGNHSEQSAYRKAVKQSQQLHGPKSKQTKKQSTKNFIGQGFNTPSKKKGSASRKDIPFKVIEGKKGKKSKKNQATN